MCSCQGLAGKGRALKGACLVLGSEEGGQMLLGTLASREPMLTSEIGGVTKRIPGPKSYFPDPRPADIQFEEKKVQKAIREAAKRGDMGAARVSCVETWRWWCCGLVASNVLVGVGWQHARMARVSDHALPPCPGCRQQPWASSN